MKPFDIFAFSCIRRNAIIKMRSWHYSVITTGIIPSRIHFLQRKANAQFENYEAYTRFCVSDTSILLT